MSLNWVTWLGGLSLAKDVQHTPCSVVPVTQGHLFSPTLPSSHHGSTIAGTYVGQVITDCRKPLYWLSLTINPHLWFPRMSMAFPLA